MNLGAIIALLKLAQDAEITKPEKPTAKKITISVGQTPLIVPVGFKFVGPSIPWTTRPKGLD